MVVPAAAPRGRHLADRHAAEAEEIGQSAAGARDDEQRRRRRDDDGTRRAGPAAAPTCGCPRPRSPAASRLRAAATESGSSGQSRWAARSARQHLDVGRVRPRRLRHRAPRRDGEAGRERVLQPAEGAGQAGLHRAGRPTGDGDGLGLGQLEEVAAGDHEAVLRGQVLQRGEHEPAALVVDRRILGCGRGRGRVTGGHPQGEVAAPPSRAAVVAGLVGHDGQQPRAELGAFAEPVERTGGRAGRPPAARRRRRRGRR